MRDVHFHWLDVFTEAPFGGNQLAVVLDGAGLSAQTMQRIAAELHVSETVFVLPPTEPDAVRRLRIFTPSIELPYAGHPTVGTAALLAEVGVGGPSFTLQETAGLVEMSVTRVEGVPTVATLTAPQTLALSEPPPTAEIARLLGLQPDDFVQTLPPVVSSVGLSFLLVPVASDQALDSVVVDLAIWHQSFEGTPAQHLYVCTPARDGRLRARMFAPGMGVAEDPATGSAATALAGYLASRADGDTTLRLDITQGDLIGRPSHMTAEADVVAGAVTAVRVGGPSVMVGEGVLRIPED